MKSVERISKFNVLCDKVELIICSLFYSISIFSQDASNTPCVKDYCITVLKNDASVLKRIVKVQ